MSELRHPTSEFTFGIEEEYFLVDAQTKLIAEDVPRAFFDNAKAATGGRISQEFLSPQIEVISSPHADFGTAREELRFLRHAVAAVAARHGLAILAAGTHPSASWRTARQTQSERYDMVMHDLQMIGQRDMFCGLHVHVRLPGPDRRIDVMYRMLPYLPLFLALSTSSPFWQGRRTGLKGYRLAGYDELPRSGIPELFRTREEFDAYVGALVRAGVIEDSSFIWWAIRPSLVNPTLELRAPDSCTLLEDALAIAALYRTLARNLFLNPQHNADLDAVQRALVVENKWRAQRYGIRGTFVTPDGAVSVSDMLERAVEALSEDAAVLGCTAEMERCRAIVSLGTSADAQLAVFESSRATSSREAALRAVAEWIAKATLE
jgi:carboxylate-amine ligase